MTGGGLSRPKKPKNEYPRMKRDEFKLEKKIKVPREGDDYYYSLKENQYSLTSKCIDSDTFNSIQISANERKQSVYSEKYSKNIEHVEGYLTATEGQS